MEGSAGPGAGTSPSAAAPKPKLLTRFLMFEPQPDEVCIQIGAQPGTVWVIVGTIDADGRDAADARFYRDVEEVVECSPVSENAWKPRKTRPRQVVPRTREAIETDVTELPKTSPRAAATTGDAAPETEEEPPADDLEVPGLTLEGEDADAVAERELAEGEA